MINAAVSARVVVTALMSLALGRPVTPIVFDEALLRFSNDRTVTVSDGRALLIDSVGQPVADLGPWPWPELWEGEDFDDLSPGNRPACAPQSPTSRNSIPRLRQRPQCE